MALTVDEVAQIREWVGAEPPQIELDTIFERVGMADAVALSVLKTRRTALRESLASQPAKLGLAGDYNHDWGNTRSVYDDAIDELQRLVDAQSDTVAGESTLTTVGTIGRTDRDGLFGL